jgi:hypothetical protein
VLFELTDHDRTPASDQVTKDRIQVEKKENPANGRVF